MSFRIVPAALSADPTAFSGRNPIKEVAQATSSFPEAVDVTYEPTASGGAMTWVASPADRAAEVSLALDSERRARFGEHGHHHVAGACGYCRRAIASYQR